LTKIPTSRVDQTDTDRRPKVVGGTVGMVCLDGWSRSWAGVLQLFVNRGSN